jgi:hypothetical protein
MFADLCEFTIKPWVARLTRKLYLGLRRKKLRSTALHPSYNQQFGDFLSVKLIRSRVRGDPCKKPHDLVHAEV